MIKLFSPNGRTLVYAILFTLVFFGLSSPMPAACKMIKMGGTGSALGTMKLIAEAFKKSHPGINVIVLPSLGSGGGIKAVLHGAIDIGLSTRTLTHKEKEQGGKAVVYSKTPFFFATSLTTDCPIDLSIPQVVEIYAGITANWPCGQPIRLILRSEKEKDTVLMMAISPQVKRAVEIALSRKGMIYTVTDQETLDRIERIPGALGTTTLGQQLSEQRPIKSLSLDGVEPTVENLSKGNYCHFVTHRLVTGPSLSPSARQFIEYLFSSEGRRLLADLGHLVVEETPRF